MPANLINSSGLTTQTLAEVINEILNGADGYPGLYQIYGTSINVNPNSPDGNMVQIYAQGKMDTLDLAQQVYSSFDPDQAVGAALDRVCAINGVVREGGTYTQQVVTISANRVVTLPGLDLNPNGGAFTVQDATGNQYQLLSTYSFTGAGSVDLIFQAVAIGAVSSAAGTITTIVTTQLGVTSANNAAGPTTVGVNQESDSALRIRRANSVELPSKGFLQGLYGALIDTPNVVQAVVLENVGSTTDANGIPGHSIWCIVNVPNTTANNLAVAEAIYVKRNAGCGMKGSVSVPVTQVDGTVFNVLFDYPTAQNLWFRAVVTAITGTVDLGYIAAQVLSQFGNGYEIGQTADTTSIVAYIKSIAPNASVSVEGVSTDGTNYYPTVNPTGVNYIFKIPSSANILIT